MYLQSELAFRVLCRRHGATAAYTPMLHSRIFLEDPGYREEHFTTCEGDRCAKPSQLGYELYLVLATTQSRGDANVCATRLKLL